MLIKPNTFPQTRTAYFGAANNLTNVELANKRIKLDKGALVCINRICSTACIIKEIFVFRSAFGSEPELGMLI